MKRILCFALCLMLALPAALAETADTLPKRFVRQLSGGNGARGYISMTASGVADWLNALLPFTATEIQVRAIGQKQGDMSESISDDDDWQIKFYAKDSDGKEAATTWLYGDPEGIYFKSELLPGTLLTLPVEQVQLLYQIFRGEFSELLFAFDPMNMKAPGANGNASAYQVVADLLGLPADEWENKWFPVLEKYFLHIDLWLAGYSDAGSILDAEGELKMSAAYTIPVEDLKAEAKYLIGQMLYDSNLQDLVLPYVTREQQITYLNPQMLYFYEACIDALNLTGEVALSREMSAMGEVVSTSIELPLPQLPDTLTAPMNSLSQKVLGISYDLMEGVNGLRLKQSGQERTIELRGEKRTVSIAMVDAAAEDNIAELTGRFLVTPNEGVTESPLSADFTCQHSHRIWQDEKYLDHDTTAFALSLTPAQEETNPDEFKPLSLAFTLDYRNNPSQENSAVQVNLDVAAKLPDAEITAEAVLRITTKVELEKLPTEGGEDVTKMTDDRKANLLDSFVSNAVNTMASLNDVAAPTTEPAAEPTEIPDAEPTTVPPLAE